MGWIYLIRNKINDKCYIGQTRRNPEIRWAEHCKIKHTKSLLTDAIIKYGQEAFEKSILCEISNEELNDRELIEIYTRNTVLPNGYNIVVGGGANRIVHSETREKISKSLMGKIRSEETKRRISYSKRGKTHSEETKIKISESGKGKKKVNNSRKVDQYSTDGVFLKTHDSLFDAKVYVNLSSAAGIIKCCKGERKTAAKFTWKYHYNT
jgi:group I intron endonuclease